MTAAPNTSLVARVARAIHEAKMKECWGWMGQANREPWEKPNAASPNQPWHDVANAQAKAALAACHAEEVTEALKEAAEQLQIAAESLGFSGYGDGPEHKAGAGEGVQFGGTLSRIRALLAKIESPSSPVPGLGYCPICGATGLSREKRPFGNDICEGSHTYPSSSALLAKLDGGV